MSFESLSETYEFLIHDFPREWLPLTHLYDADLPLFPLQYIHFLDPDLSPTSRPGYRDRLFGFIRYLNIVNEGLIASVVLNKNLNLSENARYIPLAESAVRDRLGLGNPVRHNDIRDALAKNLKNSNGVVNELWYRIVDGAFGKSLPFGRIWDGVYGLARFIASWNSDGGRKGELIQTHYFMSAFGEKISTGQNIHADFYLVPTFDEFTDSENPLNIFSDFGNLMQAAKTFCGLFCKETSLPTSKDFRYSHFDAMSAGVAGHVNTSAILKIINEKFTGSDRDALFENYNAFNRGPQRSIIALLMLNDLRSGYWDPRKLTSLACGEMYKSMSRSYQTPKVIQLYSQQCFGSACALPIDNWVQTFLEWPLDFKSSSSYYQELFQCCSVWGKVERLIWMASQARKVHASVASEILWCVRYGGPDKKMRGANPLSCKICEPQVRTTCPAYKAIETTTVIFNNDMAQGDFHISTSLQDNATALQMFVCCKSKVTLDEYSPRDRPARFLAFPSAPHKGEAITVAEFIRKY